MNTERRTLIFLHIPKTAGTTLHKVIERQYEPDTIFSTYRVVSSKLGDRWKRVPASQRWEMAKDELANLPAAQKESIRVLKGHMSFGWHELLPQPCTYITVLRDPVDRVLSQYYYTFRLKGHYLRDEILCKDIGLKDFVCSGMSWLVDNGQTRLVSGVGEDIGFRQCPHEILEIAKNNLRTFAVVGLVDKFDETLLLLRREFGWEIPFYLKQNVTRDRPLQDDVSTENLRIIEEHNELDIELYRYAKWNFEELLRQQEDSFDRDLRIFRLLNSLYTRYHNGNSGWMIRKIEGLGRVLIRHN